VKCWNNLLHNLHYLGLVHPIDRVGELAVFHINRGRKESFFELFNLHLWASDELFV